jgi:ParB family chromosome partitioning protein
VANPRSRGGLGRGLAAILPEQREADTQLVTIATNAIQPNPKQPRKRFDEDSIAELAGSVEAAGIIQPLLVRELPAGRYELIAGERRWRAATVAGLDEVPAIVRNDAEPERLQLALMENIAREDLNAVDAARACAALVEDLGVSREELGRKLGRSRSAVSNLIRLLDLPDEALELIAAGELSEGHGRAILTAKGHDQRRRLARRAVAEGWSVRQAEDAARAVGSRKAATVHEHPDRQAAAEAATEMLEAALGRDVRVRADSRGFRAELHFDDLDEVRSFANR